MPLWGVALFLTFFIVLGAVGVFADNEISVNLVDTGADNQTIETFTENFNFTIKNNGNFPIDKVDITIGQSTATETNVTVNESSIFDLTDWTHDVTYDSSGDILIINWSTSLNPIPVGSSLSFWFDAQAPHVSENTTAYWFVRTFNTNDEEASVTKNTLVINDDIPPLSTITAPLNNTYWNSLIIVNGTASDSQSGVQYVQFAFRTDILDELVDATGTTSWTYSWAPPADGIYNITSIATDNLNNTESLHKWQIITYDTVAPFVVSSSASPVFISPNTSIGQADNTTLQATASDSLSVTIFYLFQVYDSNKVLVKESGVISATNNTNVSWVWNGTDFDNNFVPDGYYNITISAWDLAGNNNTELISSGFIITVDNTHPIISNLMPTGSITDTTPILSLNTDEITDCYYSNISVSNATNLFDNTTATFHDQQLGLPLGTYTYYIKCIDPAQNDANASTTFTIAAPPQPPQPPGGGGGGGGGGGVTTPPESTKVSPLPAPAQPTKGVGPKQPTKGVGPKKPITTVSPESAPTTEGPTGFAILFANLSLLAALIGLLLLLTLGYLYYRHRKRGETETQIALPPSGL